VSAIETVAVLGASEGGTACAVLSALAGCAVRIHDGAEAALGPACAAVRRRADLALAHGLITPGEWQRILDGILVTADLDEALTGADLVVDAGGAAPDLCRRLAEALRATTWVAAAGALPPAELAARLPQPGRVFGLRLTASPGPVPRVEILATAATSGHVLERARDFAARVNGAARAGGAAP
jgi:3-hydroxyacyl-CoA dehydrogenase